MSETTPLLGIFWAVTASDAQTHLLIRSCTLADAEEYGACLTTPDNHHSTWEAWRRGQPPPPLSILAPIIGRDEYETWPRGRIVYERSASRFVVYADKQLLLHAYACIIDTFHLPKVGTVARTDLHYRNTRLISGKPK
jgi:hypothetical protein